MEHKYLAEWTRKSARKHAKSLYIHDICRWENQIFIFFARTGKYLHINLEGNPYLFFACKQLIEKFPYSRINGFYYHIKGAEVKDIELKSDDRVVSVYCQKKDIYGEIQNLILVAEVIPRNTNLILVKDATDNPDANSAANRTVIDCLRAVSFNDSSQRAVLPSQEYKYPTVSGFTLTDSEVEYPLAIDKQGRIITVKQINDYPDQIYNDTNPLFQSLFYDFYLNKRANQIKKTKLKELRNKIRKLQKKKVKLAKELEDYLEADRYKIKAELIKFNLNKIKPGMDKVELINYYQNPPSEIEVELLTDKSPLQNMNYYFKKYRKSLSGREMKQQQIVQTENDIDHAERHIFDVENTDYPPELIFSMSEKKNRKSKTEQSATRYKKIRVDADWEIFVGRTAKENDELTCKMAKPNDWWFHSRIYQGSHIILRNYAKKEVSENLILLCCRLAAYNSKAKHSSNVPVDYTQVRYVTKPHKSPPGFVIYKNQKTVFVNPLSFREVSLIINSPSRSATK